jgi:hypothetical protein
MEDYQKMISDAIKYVSCGGKIHISNDRQQGKSVFAKAFAEEFDKKVEAAREQNDKENGAMFRDGITVNAKSLSKKLLGDMEKI